MPPRPASRAGIRSRAHDVVQGWRWRHAAAAAAIRTWAAARPPPPRCSSRRPPRSTSPSSSRGRAATSAPKPRPCKFRVLDTANRPMAGQLVTFELLPDAAAASTLNKIGPHRPERRSRHHRQLRYQGHHLPRQGVARQRRVDPVRLDRRHHRPAGPARVFAQRGARPTSKA